MNNELPSQHIRDSVSSSSVSSSLDSYLSSRDAWYTPTSDGGETMLSAALTPDYLRLLRVLNAPGIPWPPGRTENHCLPLALNLELLGPAAISTN
jgi:hypothetical protein